MNDRLYKLIERATFSADSKEIIELSKNECMNVRRTIAKNINTPTNIINQLSNDPVANVSVVALQHKNCTNKRDIDDETLNHKCVSCQISEISALTKCNTCNNQ